MPTLADVVRAVLRDCPDLLTTRDAVREALLVGRIPSFVESRGKTLEMATSMLWKALQAARGPN